MTELTRETLFTTQTQPESKRLALLKQHFPNCFDKHGAFLPDKMAEILHSDGIHTQKEGYSLNWLGKSYAKLLKDTPPETLLAEDTEHNRQPENENSENLLIKGDNLEVLKHLKHAYKNQVKMIYIDPPYNTGSDGFVYQDDRKFTPEQLAELGGMSLEEAERVLAFTAKKSNSHSAWLTFMYPRLYVARELLHEDGVIFISIDDNEQAQLKILCDEVFGEENFVCDLVWLKGNAQNDADNIQSNDECILCYAKKIDKNLISKIEQEVEVKVFYDEKLNKYFYEGAGLTTGGAGGTLNARPNLGFSIYYNPKTKDFLGVDDYDKELAKISNDEQEVYTDDETLKNQGYVIIRAPKKGVGLGCWTWALEKFNNEKENILIKQNGNKFSVVKKEWLPEKQVQKDEDSELFAMIKKFSPPKSFIDFVGSGAGTKELKKIFNTKVFNNPKSTKLLKYLINISGCLKNEQQVFLDFFAGSGTTAHAVMQLNAEDGGNRRFICVQLPEKTDKNSEAYKAGYQTIFDITKERIIRSAAKIHAEHPDYSGDLGFKIFETVPLFDFQAALKTDFDPIQANLPYTTDTALSDEQLHTLLTTWRVYDGSRLPEKVQAIDLAGYTAYYCRNHLYLLASGFYSECVKALIEKLDNDKDFVPERIVLFSANIESAMQKELKQAVETYANKKGLNNLSVLARM